MHRTEGSHSSVDLLLGGTAVTALLLVFFASWWNRYLSPASGGEVTIAFLFERGMLPYRDYFISAPPGMVLAIKGIDYWFGREALTFWVIGVGLRLVGAVCLYAWLCRVVRPVWAAISVVTAFVVSSVDIADIPFGYNHVVSTLAIVGGYWLSLSLDRGTGSRVGLGILAGAFLGAAALVKQTTGLISMALLVVVATLILASRRQWRGMAWSLGSVGLGIALPLAGTLFWFQRHGLLAAFLEQTLTKGPSSKGGLMTSLLRPVTLTIGAPQFWRPALFCLAVLALGVSLWVSSRRREVSQAAHPAWWLALIALLAGTQLGRSPALFPWDLRNLYLSLAYLAMLGCLAVVLWSLAKLAAPRLGRIDPDLALIALLGFGCAYSLSMSWPAFEAMVFPGAALLIALALEKGGPDRSTPWIRGAVVGLVLVLVTTATARKHAVPFYWGRWVEPPLEASTVQPKAPELRGFLLSSVTAGFFDGVSETVKAHSRPEDRILVYPNMPILYALAQRLPATFALTHWVDVCPDFVAAADAQRLLSRPPAVIVLHPDLPVEIVTEERLFRNGKRSDVREVLAALEALSQRYQVVGVYPVPGHPIPIQVWALRH